MCCLDRFATIKEAFSFINDLAKPKRVSVKPPPKSKSHQKKKPPVVHAEDGSSDGEDQEAEAGSDEDDELWCTHCLDDDSIILCAFCGCKVLLLQILRLCEFIVGCA